MKSLISFFILLLLFFTINMHILFLKEQIYERKKEGPCIGSYLCKPLSSKPLNTSYWRIKIQTISKGLSNTTHQILFNDIIHFKRPVNSW